MSEARKNEKTKIFAGLAGLGAIIPLFSLAFSGLQFASIENARQRQQNFENYHQLISVFGLNPKSSTIAAAAIYELKNYPEYCEISLEIVDSLKGHWTGADPILLDTMDLIKPRLESVCKS